MNLFIVLPDQLFSREKDINFLLEYDEVYFVEDPVLFSIRNNSVQKLMSMTFKHYYDKVRDVANKHDAKRRCKIKYINKLDVMERGGSYVSKKEGGDGEKQFDKNDPTSFHSHVITPSFLEYFVGVNKQVNMWRPSNFWIWGDRIRDMTFNGLHINFHESAQFLLPFEEVRKYFIRGQSYSERSIIKGLCKRFDMKYELPGPVDEEYPILYKFENCNDASTKRDKYNCYFPMDSKSAEAIVERYLSKYKSAGPAYTFPQIDYILGVGLLTPADIINILRSQGDINTSMTYYILRREYFRIIYLANSDLMTKSVCNKCEYSSDEKSDAVFAVNDGKNAMLVSEKRIAEYMLRCHNNSRNNVGDCSNSPWKCCMELIQLAGNVFPWNLLPRSKGACCLNSIKGNIKHYKSSYVM